MILLMFLVHSKNTAHSFEQSVSMCMRNLDDEHPTMLIFELSISEIPQPAGVHIIILVCHVTFSAGPQSNKSTFTDELVWPTFLLIFTVFHLRVFALGSPSPFTQNAGIMQYQRRCVLARHGANASTLGWFNEAH